MNPSDYQYLTSYLLKASGLSLGDNKEYLLEARLIPLAQSWDIEGIPQLVAELKKGLDKRLATSVTEAMTTNETSFFRDKRPFDELTEHLLPPLIEARRNIKRLNIWCAAGATGQEPYSILMTIKEQFPELDSWNITLIATDIAEAPIEKGKAGTYSQFEVQRGLPIQLLMKHFVQVESGWQIKEPFRNAVKWVQLNLLDSFSKLGVFDIIFCRNVLIYFQNETKKHILDRQATMLREDGYLILGAAETVLGISDSYTRFKECRSAIYHPVAGIPVGILSKTNVTSR